MGDWGKRIKLSYDKPVYYLVSSLAITKFRLADVLGTYIYPTSVTYGETTQELYLEFDDFNAVVGNPITLEYLGGIDLGGIDIPFDAFSLSFWAKNLDPKGGHEYIDLSDVSISGVIQEAFDGKVYESEYVDLSDISISVNFNEISYSQRYLSEYVDLSNVTISGQYCDINGNPL